MEYRNEGGNPMTYLIRVTLPYAVLREDDASARAIGAAAEGLGRLARAMQEMEGKR